MLDRFRKHGAPVCLQTLPSSPGRKQRAIARGAHKSAKDHIDFLQEEFVGMINKGHWSMLSAHLIIAEEMLQLSPLGVVPQRDQRPRTICDYTYFDLNLETLPLAPAEAMQFGKALLCLLQKILHSNPRFWPICMSKIDIADGFYCLWVRADDVPKLAMLFPNRPGEEPLIALPHVLPMGWRESPPYFSMSTQTVTDLANAGLPSSTKQPPHWLDALAETPPATTTTTSANPKNCSTPTNNQQKAHPNSVPLRKPNKSDVRLHTRPTSYWDACVDDFIGLCQGNTARRMHVKRHLLHNLDKIFREAGPNDSPH